MEENNMASPVIAPESKPFVNPTSNTLNIDLSKTENCIFVTTHFSMGIGRMRQIRSELKKLVQVSGRKFR